MKPTTAHLTDGDAFALSRRTTGLSQAHRELIRLLAEIAVENYVREVETGEAAPWA